jgi:hypothetical protein
VKTLSERLSDLSDRVKTVEDVAVATRARNRAALEAKREQLKSYIAESRTQVEADAAERQDTMESWWDATRLAVDAKFAAMQAKREHHQAERDLRLAERRADDAELDAADAIEFAISVLDQAEYAVVDAAIARADAADLALQGS